jgi:hypothetical protein
MKTLAIMQPYFFPYLGYFSLIKHVDEFILFDPVQYIRHGWINRNRILKQGEGWLYIVVPLARHSHEALIKDVEVDGSQAWREKLLGQLSPYKKMTSRYREVRALVEQAIAGDNPRLVDLNRATLQAVCDRLGIDTPIRIWSQMNLEIEEPRAADEWALNTCKAIGATAYWNPPGGQSFFDRSKYEAAGIDLKFHKQNLPPYSQRRETFEPGLSIIDVLMLNDRERVHEMLDDFELV